MSKRVLKMYGTEREKEILNILSKNKYVTVDYLAEKIHISPSSIRRDLKKLELEGLITRSYGGAELKSTVNKQIPFFLRRHKNAKEKLFAARQAASLVNPGDVLFVDGSTTTYFMFDYLKNISGITVVTNSLAGMSQCSEFGINSFLTGGKLNPENRSCFVGCYSENMIKSFHADWCFFSVQSLTRDGVLYDCFENEIMPRYLMMKNAEKRVFLCDSSKINRFSAYRLCDVSEIDYIISDINMRKYLNEDYPNIAFISDEGKTFTEQI